MAHAQKWDFEGREYRPYEIPDGWFCLLYSPDMDTVINCASCGKMMTYGDGYTSRCVHNQFGLGYAVCEKCYEKEWMAENAVREENSYED